MSSMSTTLRRPITRRGVSLLAISMVAGLQVGPVFAASGAARTAPGNAKQSTLSSVVVVLAPPPGPGAVAGSVSAAPLSVPTSAILPPATAKLAAAAMAHVDGQCRATALSVADPKNAKLEVREATAAPSAVVSVSAQGVIVWFYGEIPGRYVGLVAATRSGRPVQIRATVGLRGQTCRLAAWRNMTTG